MLGLRLLVMVIGVVIGLALIKGIVLADEGNTRRARQFIQDHVSRLRPLEVAANLAWWNANTRGRDEDFKEKERAQNRIDEALADARQYKALEDIKNKAGIDDPLVARQIELLYLAYLEKQVEPALLKKMVATANKVEKAFNVYRARVHGKEMTDSEVRHVLKNSKDSAHRKTVWEASKEVGSLIAQDLGELVKLRNQAAVKLGFKNYHALQLHVNEQNGGDLIKLFDELDELTREPFRSAKAEIDHKLAHDYQITPAELMPWHYHDPFFQESPAVFAVSLDQPYERADILRLCRDFYAGIGLPIDDVLARSDLYEKPKKSPHAFCTDIDREGDVRVLANIKPNEYWMGTMLHELGHAVYSSKNIPSALPYLVRGEAHILTTEGVAMLFERLSKQRRWLDGMGVTVAQPEEFDKTAARMQQNQLLIFSRWCQVMLRFEKSMYENPDQDLNKLWWDLVERYQELRRPVGRDAPDYASKIHIASAPVYYHNYQMGQLFASQVHHTIVRELYAGADPNTVTFIGNKAVGKFMKDRVFTPGRTLNWNELTRHATGETLNSKAFADDFKSSRTQ